MKAEGSKCAPSCAIVKCPHHDGNIMTRLCRTCGRKVCAHCRIRRGPHIYCQKCVPKKQERFHIPL